jgi:hypothetical protein
LFNVHGRDTDQEGYTKNFDEYQNENRELRAQSSALKFAEEASKQTLIDDELKFAFETNNESAVDYRIQGDPTMYTREAMKRRTKLKRHPMIQQIIIVFWNTYQKDYWPESVWEQHKHSLSPGHTSKSVYKKSKVDSEKDSSLRQREYIPKEEYLVISQKLQKAMVRPQYFNSGEAKRIALDDWQRDTTGQPEHLEGITWCVPSLCLHRHIVTSSSSYPSHSPPSHLSTGPESTTPSSNWPICGASPQTPSNTAPSYKSCTDA